VGCFWQHSFHCHSLQDMSRRAIFRRQQVSNLLFLAAADEASQAATPFRKKLVRASRRLRQGKIRRGALLPPAKSAFEVLFTSGQEDALVTLCGFDHASFAMIHTPFRTYLTTILCTATRGELFTNTTKQRVSDD
jgi:hypothetical protein